MSARDEAVRLAIKLFGALFRRLWLAFGEREERIIAALIDYIIQAAAEARCFDELDDLDEFDTDDDDPPPPPPAMRSYAGRPHAKPPAIPQEVRG